MPLTSFSQADTVLTERRRLERPLLAMVWLGAAALSVIEASPLYMLAASIAVVVNMLAVRRHREIYLRRGVINAAVLLASIVLLVELVSGNGDVRLALGHYLILIQLCKLFERKTNRDYVQLLILSGLVMIVAALLSSELWFAATLVVYLALACHSAMVFTLKRGLDAAAAATLPSEPEPIAPRQVARNVTRRWPGRTLVRYVALALTGMLVVGAALFLVAPRGEPWAAAAMRRSVASGMSASPKLGQAKRIRLSDRVVMRVRQRGGPVSEYMRGRVFYSYANSRWSSAGLGWSAEPPTTDDPDVIARAAVQDIAMAADLLPTLFVAQPAVKVTSDEGLISTFGDTWQLVPGDHISRSVRYRVHVLPTTSNDPAAARSGYSWPAGMDPRRNVYIHRDVAALARTWCRDLLESRRPGEEDSGQTVMRIATRLAGRLRGHCTYTLDLTDASGQRDGVEDFLFHLRRGHCEYFASALTVMCRSLGLRARLATGFRPSPPPGAENYLVRQRDAHAWTEVYVPSRGWVVFDATPAAAAQAAQAEMGWLQRLWASMKAFWQENVLEYDSAAREALVERLQEAWQALTAALARTAHHLKMSLVKLLVSGQVDRALFHLAVAIGLLGLAIEVVLVVRAVRRRARHKRLVAGGQAVPWWQFDFARRLFVLFEKHGHRLEAALTLRQWARHAAGQLGLPAAQVDHLVALYYRLRWGRRPASADELARARGTVDRLAGQLAGKQPVTGNP